MQGDSIGVVRPVTGIGALVFAALLGAAVLAGVKQGEPVRAPDANVTMAHVQYVATDGTTPAAELAQALPGMVVAPFDPTTLTVGATCGQIQAIAPTTVCDEDDVLLPEAAANLGALLGLPRDLGAGIHLDPSIDDSGGGEHRLIVAAPASTEEFEEKVKAAAAVTMFVLQVLTIEDLRMFASPLWAWVTAGATAAAVMALTVMVIAAVGRSVERRYQADLLRRIGTPASVARRLASLRFAAVYMVVVGTMYVMGVFNAWVMVRRLPGVAYPWEATFAVAAFALAALATGVAAARIPRAHGMWVPAKD
jgi:hypothetical protein